MTPAEKKREFTNLIVKAYRHEHIRSVYRLQIDYAPSLEYTPFHTSIKEHRRLFWHIHKKEVQLRDRRSNILARGAEAILKFEEHTNIKISEYAGLSMLLFD